MSGNSDRSIRGNGWIVAVAVVLAAAAGAGVYYHSYRPGAEPVRNTDAPGNAQAPAMRTDETYTVILFFPGSGMLDQVPGGIRRHPEPQLDAREAVTAVLGDPRVATTPVLKDMQLRALYLDGTGTAYVDLATGRQRQKDVRASAWDELLAVYALVNTVTRNFAEVRQVRFLADGREAQTLAGHIDLTRAFFRRDDIVRQAH